MPRERAAFVLVVHGENENRQFGKLPDYLFGQLDTVRVGQANIDNDRVGPRLPNHGQTLGGSAGLAADQKFVREIEQPLQSLSQEQVIVDNDDAFSLGFRFHICPILRRSGRLLSDPLHGVTRHLPGIGKIQLFLNVGTMCFHRFRAQMKFRGDIAHFMSFADQFQDLQLTVA